MNAIAVKKQTIKNDSLVNAVNSLIRKFEFTMFECKDGYTWFLHAHYNNTDYTKSKRLKVGKGTLGSKQYHYLTDEII